MAREVEGTRELTKAGASEAPPVAERLLRLPEVGEILNVSLRAVYKLIERGELKTLHVGGAHRVRPEDLRAYIRSQLDKEREQ